ncbi:MAG: VTC domain-containing protein, partial [Cyanobacteria bacterium]|nr:VTC domain-containing protein [Cyanobacteriota bacterium]
MNQSSSHSSSNVSIPVNLAYERIRYELKYPVTYEQAHQTLEDLEPYLEPDPYGHQGQYVIYSVYFDTRNLTFYHEKIDGFAGRVKFRLRTYLSPKASIEYLPGSEGFIPSKQFSPLTSSSPWFLETKERVRHYIAK